MASSLQTMNNMSHQHNQHHPPAHVAAANASHMNGSPFAPTHASQSPHDDDFHGNPMVGSGSGGTGPNGNNTPGVPSFDDSLLHEDVEDDDGVVDDDDLDDGGIGGPENSGVNGANGNGNGPADWTDPTAQITKPGTHDVLLGRGGGTNNHIGNVKFRKLVNEHKMRYLACSKVEKPKVARQVVALWRKLDPPGRFLARADDTKRGPGSVKASDNVWLEVGDKKAREKASQCLRERTADVLPYIKHLREQQNAITEHGVSMVQMQLQQHESSQQQQQLQQRGMMHNNHMNGSGGQQQQQQHNMMSAQFQQQQQHGMQQGPPHHPRMGQHQMMQQQHQMMQQHQHPSNAYSGGFDPSSSGPSYGMHSPTGGYSRNMVGSSSGASPRRSSLPMAPMQGGGNGGMGGPHHLSYGSNSGGGGPSSSGYPSPRRTSMPLMTNMNSADMSHLSGNPMHVVPPPSNAAFDFESHPMVMNNGHGNNGNMNSDYDLSEMEYQQQMLMMQQQMMQQQMQMQRMQQSRSTNGRGGLSGGGGSGGGGAVPTKGSSAVEPLVAASNSQVGAAAHHNSGHGHSGNHREGMPTSALKTKRGRGNDGDDDHKTAPDRTTSLMSLTPLQDPSNDHELSLEDYRQQLEEYIANSHNNAAANAAASGGHNAHDNGDESDLEDDWEKERERAVKQAQQLKKDSIERGVNRNASGMSILSKASGGGMSLVSGFSGLSDLLKDENKDAHHPNKAGAGGAGAGAGGDREQKMNMARSVSSNLSLMSELTDLSQNIDNLSIYDD